MYHDLHVDLLDAPACTTVTHGVTSVDLLPLQAMQNQCYCFSTNSALKS